MLNHKKTSVANQNLQKKKKLSDGEDEYVQMSENMKKFLNNNKFFTNKDHLILNTESDVACFLLSFKSS